MRASGPFLFSAVLFLSANASTSLTDFLSGDAVLAWGGLVSSIANGGDDAGNGDDFGGGLPFGTLGGNMHLSLTSLLWLLGKVSGGDDDDDFDGELPFCALLLTTLLSLTGLRPRLVFPLLLCDAIMDQEFMGTSLKSSSVGILEESRPVCSRLTGP